MTKDVFAETSYGKVALRKFKKINPNFRIYTVEWLNGGKEVMKVTGADFRKAKTGKLKGILSIFVRGTKQKVLVTAEEMSREAPYFIHTQH